MARKKKRFLKSKFTYRKTEHSERSRLRKFAHDAVNEQGCQHRQKFNGGSLVYLVLNMLGARFANEKKEGDNMVIGGHRA